MNAPRLRGRIKYQEQAGDVCLVLQLAQQLINVLNINSSLSLYSFLLLYVFCIIKRYKHRSLLFFFRLYCSYFPSCRRSYKLTYLINGRLNFNVLISDFLTHAKSVKELFTIIIIVTIQLHASRMIHFTRSLFFPFHLLFSFVYLFIFVHIRHGNT